MMIFSIAIPDSPARAVWTRALVLVAFSTDPDILLLIESRQTAAGPRWFFQAARFSDKSLWLAYREKDVWTSLRQGHGTDTPNAPDHQYHVDYVTADAPLECRGDASDDTP